MYEFEPSDKRRSFNFGNLLFTIIGSLIGGMLILALIAGGVIKLYPSQQTWGQVGKTSGASSAPLPAQVDSPVVAIAEKVGPAVVGIISKTDSSVSHPWAPVGGGTGSGVIFDTQGYIVTNNHVVAQASGLDVVLADGRRLPAKLVGTDELTDLAVLKVSADKLTATSFGDSDKLRVGELAVAIGNPMGEDYYGSVTAGIISATRRTVSVGEQQYLDLLQTDAAINPGNSGGALVNAAGQLIGINSVKLTGDKIEGMGFAIPSNTVQRVINDLVKKGEVVRPWLGVQYQGDVGRIPNSPKGIDFGVVITPTDKGPAQKAGMQPGDAIIGINGQKISNFPDLQRVVLNSKIGDKLEVTVFRSGKEEKLFIILEQRPQ